MFTVYCLLFTVSGLLSTGYCVLCTVYYQLSTVYCLLFAVYCLLSTVYCLLSTAYCFLSTVYCLLFTVYGVWSTLYCLLVYWLVSSWSYFDGLSIPRAFPGDFDISSPGIQTNGDNQHQKYRASPDLFNL